MHRCTHYLLASFCHDRAAKLIKSTKFVQRAQYLQKFPPEVSVPEKIKTVIGIVQLDLSENEITVIPSSIELLINLSEISLRHNRIADVPAELLSLPRLERLDLSYNIIATCASMERATSLRQLVLNHNHLQRLPPAMHRLSKLEALDLAANKLADNCWPPDLDWGKLVALEKLDLADNTLDALPPAYVSLCVYVCVFVPAVVYACRLGHLAIALRCVCRISSLPALRELKVQGNKLDTVPPDVRP